MSVMLSQLALQCCHKPWLSSCRKAAVLNHACTHQAHRCQSSLSRAPYSIVDTIMTGAVIIMRIHHGCILALHPTSKLLHDLDQADAGMQITATRRGR